MLVRRGPAPLRLTSLAAFVLVAAATVPACRDARPAPGDAALRPGSLRGSNVLLVTIDTLRVDRVGAYGGGRLTPTLDRLAAGGVRFARAYAHAPMTLPAHASILTGLFPVHHGVHINGSAGLDDRPRTLAEILKRAGYRTGAFVGSFVLDARFGLGRGFDVYDDRVGTETGPVTFGFVERSADRVAAAAGDWIAGPTPVAGPWFAWVHFFDPHAPYRAPRAIVEDPYDNEVAFADAELGLLLQRIDRAGQLARTLVVVIADHGESLGDHGEDTHGLFAYDSTLHIPFIANGPGLLPRTVTTLAAQVDLLPTVAELLGLETPPAVDGRSLTRAMAGAPDSDGDRSVPIEALDASVTRNWAPLTGVVVGNWKYIDLPIPELYDLARDPVEQDNLAGKERSRLSALQRVSRQWKIPTTTTARELDPDVAARLRALGYSASSGPPAPRQQYGPEDDPKRLVEIDRRYQQALHLTGDGRHAEAVALFRDVIRTRADFTAAYLTLASVLIETGQPGEAVKVLMEARRRGLADPKIPERLGAAYLSAGDRQQAVRVLEPLMATGASVDAMNALAVAYAEGGQHDRARALFARAVTKAPTSASVWNNLGLLELSDRRAPQAAAAFERAVEADPDFGPGWTGLGAARATSNPAAAIPAWTRAVALLPQDYETLYNLGVAMWEAGQREAARPYLERFVRQAPAARYGKDIARLRQLMSR